MTRLTGTVKSYNNAKGYGFIAAKNAHSTDTFFHIKQCAEGVTPKEGQQVSYEIGTDNKGRSNAVNVSVL